jgi:EAL domain-containing protein (putative c-di-GMP-specific phosphodiesterase class I)
MATVLPAASGCAAPSHYRRGNPLLELEITESWLVENLDRVLPLPLDRLKIDRSFVVDTPHSGDDSAIVRAIIAMTRHLGLGVIAEGVETEAQLTFLNSEGCAEIQGYWFAEPVPHDQLGGVLQALEERLKAGEDR